jgi:hypothetical protein
MKLFDRNPLKNLLQDPLNGQERLSLDARVVFLQHIPMVVQDHGICADGSDINA